MATLEKLSVCGIRSFGEESEGKIPFSKPVTLILGENGCGKSTIIECLRYVTTQKDPTGKGNFVRDPNLTNSNTVKASIKLRLKTAGGDEVHLCRGLMATRARKTVTSKTLDATISVLKPGETAPKSISSRCVDTQSETLRLLGTSKAILDNVIFCSQDDSFWPLDTDKALKEKFDLIFDSDTYNKCLNKVRDVHKKLKAKKPQLEQDIAYHREKMTAAAVKRRDSEKITRNIGNLQSELETLERELDPLYEKLKTIDTQERELSKVHVSRETTKTELNGLENEEKELKARLAGHEFIGSNEELMMALAECNAQGRNTNELKGELIALKDEEQAVLSQVSARHGRVGQLLKMVEINKGKVAEKDRKLTQIASLCKVKACEESISQYISDAKKEVTALQQEHEITEEAGQAKVNKARDDFVNQKAEVKRLEDVIKENKREIMEIKRDLDSAGESQLRRERLTDDLRVVEQQLSQHQQKTDVNSLTAQLQRLQKELKIAEEKLAETEKEVKRLQSHAENGRELEYLKLEFSKKDAEVRRLRNSHRETLIELLGAAPDKNFKQVVEQRGVELAAQGKYLRNLKASKDGAKCAVRSSIAQIGSLLQKKNAELQKFTDEVYELTNGVDLNESIEMTKKRVSELQKDKGDLEASQYMYEKYINALQRAKPCCPLCTRDFAAEEEARTLAASLQRKMRDLPDRLQRTEADLREKTIFQRTLYDMETQQRQIDRLRNEEIPALTKEQEEKRAEVTKLTRDAEEIDQKLEKIEKEREMCTNMLGDMALIDQSVKVLDNLKEDIQRIEPLLPPGWNKDLLKKAEDEREKIAAERKRLEVEREKTQIKINQYNDELLLLQNKKHTLAEQELSLRSKDGQTKQQEDRLQVLRTQEITLLGKIETARELVAPLEEAHSKFVEDLKAMKETHKNALKVTQSKLDSILAYYRDLERLTAEIADFTRRGDEMKLEGLKADIVADETNLKSIKIKIENVNSKLGDLSKIEVRRHNLEDNKALREKMRRIESLRKKYAELVEKFGNLGYDQLVREKRSCKEKVERIGQRKANIGGQIGTLEAQKISLEKELESAMYKDIDTRFTEALVLLKINESQATDLHRYGMAMEYAMSAYHERSMKRVNSYIREYWSKIYRGNDIDYIEIHTEQAEATEHRRIFNYKLVQKKGYAELDMRNRCSAGQKMLACLIVRMALAEVFSVNCGILTLDEPTTNLDKKNIHMLAETLNDLIVAKSRMANSNFQLVIITHDKEFIKHITSANAIESYVEVSRNQHGTTQIEVRNVDD